MIHRLRISAFLLTLSVVAFTGCDTADPAFEIEPYLGTYTGTRVILEEGAPLDQEDITVTLAADQNAGTVTLTLVPEPGLPEALMGTYDENGINFDQTQTGLSLDFTIDVDGDISGDGTFNLLGVAGDVTVSGMLTTRRFDLDTELVITQGDENNPTGRTTSTQIRATR